MRRRRPRSQQSMTRGSCEPSIQCDQGLQIVDLGLIHRMGDSVTLMAFLSTDH